MAKNYFGVPQLNEEQRKIAKFLKIESTDTIGILVGLINDYPDAHWLAAGWLSDILVSDLWGSAWSEVFSDLAKHFGSEKIEYSGIVRLRSLILERIYDSDRAQLTELLEEVASVLAGGASVAAIQPKIEHPKTTSCVNELHLVTTTRAILDHMLVVIEQRGFSTEPAMVLTKESVDGLAALARDIIAFSRNLIYDRRNPWDDYNDWLCFVGTLLDTLPDLTATVGPSQRVDSETITLACLVTALNILSGRNYDQDIHELFHTPGISPDLKTRWDSSTVGAPGRLPEIMQVFVSGVIGALEIKEHLKNQASIPSRPSFSGFVSPIAYTAIPEREIAVQAAKNSAKEKLATAFKNIVGAPSAKLVLLDLFFLSGKHPSRSTWLPLEYDKVEAIRDVDLSDALVPEELKVVASFVTTFMANLKESDIDGVTFFQAYWLMQAATKRSFQNVLDRYNHFYPDTAFVSTSVETERFKELFKDKKVLEVFWKTVEDFISQ